MTIALISYIAVAVAVLILVVKIGKDKLLK